jgi:hypothetical protein
MKVVYYFQLSVHFDAENEAAPLETIFPPIFITVVQERRSSDICISSTN